MDPINIRTGTILIVVAVKVTMIVATVVVTVAVKVTMTVAMAVVQAMVVVMTGVETDPATATEAETLTGKILTAMFLCRITPTISILRRTISSQHTAMTRVEILA